MSQGQCDSAFDSIIKAFHSIRGQKHGALEIFQLAPENRNEAIGIVVE